MTTSQTQIYQYITLNNENKKEIRDTLVHVIRYGNAYIQGDKKLVYYVYIKREIEMSIQKDREMCVYIHTYIHIHTARYVYVYTDRELYI